jgi:DNA-binding XRE family transcriptional regulator
VLPTGPLAHDELPNTADDEIYRGAEGAAGRSVGHQGGRSVVLSREDRRAGWAAQNRCETKGDALSRDRVAMDKRHYPLPLDEQLALRRQAVDDVVSNPDWTLQECVRHLRKKMRLTSDEMAALAGVSSKTIQDIEQGRSAGTVQTMNRIFGMLGLKLAVVRVSCPR